MSVQLKLNYTLEFDNKIKGISKLLKLHKHFNY